MARRAERGWTEADSQAFVDQGAVFVPARGEQVDVVRSLVPAEGNDVFTVVELGAGQGVLARSILETFPRCRYVALDGSALMRRRLGQTLAPYAGRVEVRAFELADRRWRAELPKPLRCVVSSLVIHHLPDRGKQQLFADLARRIEAGGALLVADIVKAPGIRAASVFAHQWDALARAQSLEHTGRLDAFEVFRRDGWNFYRADEPDPVDQPSTLLDQLRWLEAAGFSSVDCFWMRAGHAIYGGIARGRGRRRRLPARR